MSWDELNETLICGQQNGDLVIWQLEESDKKVQEFDKKKKEKN